jgi:glycosyltransferase involved in cell wall biosynthesis
MWSDAPLSIAMLTGTATRRSIDFVVPAHNEAASVGAVVRAIRGSACCRAVIVVADACHDATAAEAQAAGAELVVEVAAHDKGTAMARGLDFVRTPSVGFVDADLEGLQPEHLDALASFPGEMAVGCGPGARELIASTTPLPPIGGQRVLPTAVARAADLSGSGYEAEMKLNLAARQMGVRTVEVPLPGLRHPIDEANFDPVKQLLKLWPGVARGWWSYLRGGRPAA